MNQAVHGRSWSDRFDHHYVAGAHEHSVRRAPIETLKAPFGMPVGLQLEAWFQHVTYPEALPTQFVTVSAYAIRRQVTRIRNRRCSFRSVAFHPVLRAGHRIDGRDWE
jgi:hypothetical protein